MKKLLNVNLALFDGEAAGSAAPGATASGEGATQPQGNANNPRISRRGKSGDYSNVVFGKQPAAVGDANNPSAAGKSDTQDAEASDATREARRKAYDEFIRGEGKEFYTEDTQAMINKRFAESKKTIGELESHNQQMKPIIDALMQRYNVTDIAGLQKAIDNDNDYWAKAAEEAGMDVQTFKRHKQMEMEIAAFQQADKARKDAEKAQEQLRAWDAEAQALKTIFPDFDLSVEAKNRDFLSLIERRVPMEQAYRLVHMDELMSDAARTAEKNTVANVRAKGARPAENGTASQSAFTVKDDVSKLAREDRAEIAKRVARGEKIYF